MCILNKGTDNLEQDKSLYAKVFGLTGSSGSGKSSVLNMLKESGQSVLSADKLAREILQPSTEAYKLVLKEFGEDILEAPVNGSHDAGRSIDRAKLGKLIFSRPEMRAILEAITHPAIRIKANQIIKDFLDQGSANVFYDIPLLFEKNLDILGFKKIILVSAPEQVLIERIMRRDSISQKEAENRLASQLKDSEKRNRSDFIIENTGSIDDLKLKVEQLLRIV